MTAEELTVADRATLIQYLESWGFACYDHETTDKLRTAAVENSQTEDAEARRIEQAGKLPQA